MMTGMSGIDALLGFLALAAIVRAARHVLSTPAGEAGEMGERPRLDAWRVIRIGLWAVVLFASTVAFLASSILLLLTIALSPAPGADVALTVLKAVDAVGWLSLGLWLMYEYLSLRPAILVPPLAGWAWTYLAAAMSSGLGHLNWGP